MFDELNKYKNNGHFFFKKGDKLSEVSKGVPNAPGIYIINRLSKGNIDLVYIGKSGSMEQNGEFKAQLLRKRLNNKQDGVKRQEYFDNKLIEENIEALDIYWYVTFDDDNQDLPGFIEGLLLQRYYDIYGELPVWNKSY